MLPWDDSTAGKDDTSHLVYLSNLIGADLSLVQPGGGNTSVKIEEADLFGQRVQVLAVKGSGTDLRTITASGFTHLYLDRLASIRERDSMTDEEMMALMGACMLFADRDPVPSVETPLHSLLPQKFVAHTHDVASLSLTDTPSARQHVNRVFGEGVAFLDYVRPGFPLAKRMAEMYGEGVPSGAIGLAMEKHGLAAWGETARECYENLALIVTRASEYVAEARKGKQTFGPSVTPALDPEARRAAAIALAPVIRGELMAASWRCVLTFDDSAEVLEAIGAERFAEIAARGVMTPEHILRAGRRALVVDAPVGARHASPPRVVEALGEAREEYAAYAAAHRQPEPLADWLKVVLVPGVGAFYAGKDRRNALITGECYLATLATMAGAEAVERFEFLSDADACEMEYWPLERRKIDESTQSLRALEGKVAIVIGGASGIGRATALRFAAEGAHVAIADIDVRQAEAVADEIGTDRALAVTADATDPASIEGAIAEAVLRFGGVDVLFYSAGVAPALYAVADMPDAEVVKQLQVHYQGAVAATRAASQVMLAQQRGGRLIYNASKAAFAPGEGAAAYGASKAALVHYVRNAANELSRHGITANYMNADAIDTPLFRALVAERSAASGTTAEETLARYAERSVFRTATVPAEAVAAAALWLASEGSGYTSGCVITVGGGAEGMPR